MEKQIISFIHANPCLYDKENSNYKNMNLKEILWRDFADEIEVNVKDVKKRWRTLKDTFYRETKKLNQPSGSGAKTSKQWKYLESLSFLKDGTDHRESEGNYDPLQLPEANDSQIKLFEFDLANIQEDFSSTMPDIAETPTSSTSMSKKRRFSSENLEKELLINQVQDQFSKVLEAATNPMVKTTPMTLFFHSLAQQVDEAQLPFSDICDLQFTVLRAVQNKIKEVNERNKN